MFGSVCSSNQSALSNMRRTYLSFSTAFQWAMADSNVIWTVWNFATGYCQNNTLLQVSKYDYTNFVRCPFKWSSNRRIHPRKVVFPCSWTRCPLSSKGIINCCSEWQTSCEYVNGLPKVWKECQIVSGVCLQELCWITFIIRTISRAS